MKETLDYLGLSWRVLLSVKSLQREPNHLFSLTVKAETLLEKNMEFKVGQNYRKCDRRIKLEKEFVILPITSACQIISKLVHLKNL